MKNKENSKPINKSYNDLVPQNLRYIKTRLELREKKHNITYEDIAGRIGKSRGAVEKWFSGAITPTRAVLNVIAAYANAVALFPVDITAADIANRDLRAITDRAAIGATTAPANHRFLNNFNIIIKHMALAEGRNRLSRDQIAQRMGLKKNTIAKWYSKNSKPSPETLYKICDYVNAAGIFSRPIAPADLELGDLSGLSGAAPSLVSDVPAAPPQAMDDMQRINHLARRLTPNARAALIAFLESIT